MHKIKIVFVIGSLEIGGSEKQLIETVQRLNRDHFDVRVLALPGAGKVRTILEALHIPLTCLGFSLPKGRFHPAALVRIARMLRGMIRYFRQEQPQIVQSYLLWTNIYSCVAAKIVGVPVIVTGRKELCGEHYRKFPDWWLHNLTNRWATMIIANSHYVKQECLHYEAYVTAEKIQVIYNGIDLARYEPGRYAATAHKHAFGLPSEALVVGMIANLRPCKGHQDLVQAAALVLQRYPQTIFLLVGQDRGLQLSLEQMAAALGIRSALVFAGARDDIPELLAIIDVVVSASLTESLSNAIIEGMAMQKPLIATQVGGSPELVGQNETGFLVPPQNPQRLAEALLDLLGNPALRSQMGAAGRRKVEERLRMELMIQATETLYQKLVANANNYLTKA